jgi:hypothetical protein
MKFIRLYFDFIYKKNGEIAILLIIIQYVIQLFSTKKIAFEYLILMPECK